MQGNGLSGNDGIVGVRTGDDENLAVGIVGVGSHGDYRAADGGKIQAGGKAGGVFRDDDGVALRNDSMRTGKRTGRFSEMRPK